MTSSVRLIAILSAILAVGPLAVEGARAQDSGLARATEDFDAGRYADAARTLETITTSSPQADAFYWLGRARFELHDYAGAAAALRKATELAPQNGEAHRWLGRAYGEQADRERSFSLARRTRREFEEAVQVAPSSIAARRDLMQFYVEAPWIVGGSDSKALDQIAAIAAIDNVAGHLARAAYHAHKGDRTRARVDYRAVLDARPKNVDAYVEAAEFAEKQQDVEELRAVLEAADASIPAAPELTYFRGVLGVLTGRDSEKTASLLNAYAGRVPRSDRPSPAAAREWLGRLYESLQRPADAATEYKKALALEPGRKRAAEGLRRVSRDGGR